uniref:Putative ovule protein n=1 Tax=Solanum chacoense TaxID=4108 RepID=A0A0V0HKW8_SOLCH
MKLEYPPPPPKGKLQEKFLQTGTATSITLVETKGFHTRGHPSHHSFGQLYSKCIGGRLSRPLFRKTGFDLTTPLSFGLIEESSPNELRRVRALI